MKPDNALQVLRIAPYIALMLTFQRPVGAQVAARPALKKITLKVNQAAAEVALKALFEQAGVPYRFERVVDPNEECKVSISLKDVPFPKALEQLFRALEPEGELTYRVEKGVYVIRPGNFIEQELVSLTVRNVPLYVALRRLCDQIKASYVLSVDDYTAKPVTLTLHNIPFKEAAERLLAVADTRPKQTVWIMRGIVLLMDKNLVSYNDVSQGEPRKALPGRIAFRFEGEDLYHVSKAILLTRSRYFTLDPILHGHKIVLASNAVSLPKALDLIHDKMDLPFHFLLSVSEAGVYTLESREYIEEVERRKRELGEDWMSDKDKPEPNP